MKTTRSPIGRIGLPKAQRRAGCWKIDQMTGIRTAHGGLDIEVVLTPMQLKKRGEGIVAVPDKALPPLAAERVRDTLERVRR